MHIKKNLMTMILGISLLIIANIGCRDSATTTSAKLESISIDSFTLMVNETKTITITATYDNAQILTISSGVTYTSNNGAATIDGQTVSGNSIQANVTIDAEYKGQTDSITINVVAAGSIPYVVFDDALRSDVSNISDVSDTNTMPFWNGSTTATGVVVASTTDEKYAGTSSIEFDFTAMNSGWNGFSIETSVPADFTDYNALTFWVKSSGAAINVAKFGYMAGTDLEINLTSVAIDGTWAKIVIPLPVPSRLNACAALFTVAHDSATANDKFYVDQIQYENLGTLSLTNVHIGTPSYNLMPEGTQAASAVVGTWDNGGDTITVTQGSGTNIHNYLDWTSSNEAVATVDTSGTITAEANGDAVITAEIDGVATLGSVDVHVGPIDPDNTGDGKFTLYATNAATVDSAITVTISDWSSGSALDPAYTDADYNPVYKVVEGWGWGAASAAIAFSGMQSGFIDYWSYTNLHFKIKNLPTTSVYVKFSTSGAPELELERPLSTYASAIGGTTGWYEVTIPLSAFPDGDSYTEFAIHGGWSNGGTFYVTDVYLD